MKTLLISPKYSCRDGMVGKREEESIGQQPSDQAIWWLQLDFSQEEEYVCLELHTDLKEGFFRFSVVAETDNGEQVVDTKVGGQSFHKCSEEPIFIDFFNPDVIPNCLQSDALNIRCLIEIPTRVLTIEEKGVNA
eukprot:GHVP01056419.1.p1 GENE.GHVP01056419.1~~GHVP01056419.1.p1  ORF type:complete len:146 (+),score=31.83 GHVP01056419.1:34-438(+)